MIKVVLGLVALNFVFIVTSSYFVWRTRKDIRELSQYEARAIRAMHDAAVRRGEVVAMHPEAHEVYAHRSDEEELRRPLELVV